ncbi:hypothetical protein [Streptomyces sp. NPDC002057]
MSPRAPAHRATPDAAPASLLGAVVSAPARPPAVTTRTEAV